MYNDSVIINSLSEKAKRILWEGKNAIKPSSSILNIKRDPSRTTERYVETDDVEVIETLNAHGWFITEYNEVRTRGGKRQGYQKYCAIYENDDLSFNTAEGKARLVQYGSHDGTTTLQLHGGFFRFACANGLLCGDSIFEPVSVKHIGDLPLEVNVAIQTFAETVPFIFERIAEFQDKQLSEFQAVQFARQAAQLRFSDGQSVKTEDVLRVRRHEDQGLSLWTVYNRVQENLLSPTADFKLTNANNKSRKVRTITNIDVIAKINKELWHLAESFLRS
jgi:hypothetical protein